MSTPDALARSPKTFAERDAWMRAVLASDLPDAAVRVAIRIALHLRVSTGRCDPSYTTLATESHVAERSVYRLVALLEQKGWLSIQRTRGRHSNQYVLLNPANPMAGLNPAIAETGLNAANPDSRDNPTVPNRASNPANMVADKKRRTTKRTTKGKESDSRPCVVSRGFKNDTKGKNTSAPNLAEAFERFWRAYPRKVGRAAAQTAFEHVVERGAEAEVLIEAAARFAVIRAGEPEKYTPYASRWLREQRWEDAPPAGAVIDQEGNVVAVEQPHQERKLSASDELLAEIEAKGGGWF
jgi:hypothetical protein